MAPGQQSPYSAISAMAIDPIYIRVPDVPEFAAHRRRSVADGCRSRAPRRGAAGAEDRLRRRAPAEARGAAGGVRAVQRVEWRHDTGRARELKAFISEQAWWVEDYALFRAIHASQESARGPNGPPRCSAASPPTSIARGGS